MFCEEETLDMGEGRVELVFSLGENIVSQRNIFTRYGTETLFFNATPPRLDMGMTIGGNAQLVQINQPVLFHPRFFLATELGHIGMSHFSNQYYQIEDLSEDILTGAVNPGFYITPEISILYLNSIHRFFNKAVFPTGAVNENPADYSTGVTLDTDFSGYKETLSLRI